ncbi:MAG: peptide-methionine (S)-S-oxide reductase [Candidatus Levybacteria bacterium CG10_big_fil_rev_8_21_14_0_10_36_7]|nr:MAG: peptide-methionine (S)-S-oxide reductase [Candidatus Levybacteria bacterium CG10_big_fil_rev_8_21_14_0_10_36_7]
MKDFKNIATFAGGCFWCTEAVFRRIKGIEAVVPGYTGGTTENPSYEDVCSGTTGHAEAIQISFNPKVISYEVLLDIFFKLHDPTSLNRQDHDVGTQYRSAIFYHDKKQKDIAQEKIKLLEKQDVFKDRIVTEVVPFTHFFEAEESHKNYYENNKSAGYCQVIIDPKIKKLYKNFGENLKDEYIDKEE